MILLNASTCLLVYAKNLTSFGSLFSKAFLNKSILASIRAVQESNSIIDPLSDLSVLNWKIGLFLRISRTDSTILFSFCLYIFVSSMIFLHVNGFAIFIWFTGSNCLESPCHIILQFFFIQLSTKVSYKESLIIEHSSIRTIPFSGTLSSNALEQNFKAFKSNSKMSMFGFNFNN